MRKSTHVAVVGAGPSLKKNLPAVRHWVNKHKAIVISANYKHDLDIDYTMFMDDGVFKRNRHKAEGLIVITPELYNNTTVSDPKMTSRFRVLNVKDRKKYKPLKQVSISIKKNGQINYSPPNSGYAARLLSTLCQPKELLIAGFDGRIIGKKDYKMVYKNGETNKKVIPKQKRWVNRDQMYQLKNVILPYIKNLNIKVYAFDSDRLRGLKKSTLDIEIIK